MITSARAIANRLSQLQRDILLNHIATEVPVNRCDSIKSFLAMVRLGLIQGATQSNRPTHTVLTSLGREVAAVCLAEAAEALVRAGFLDGPAPSLDSIKQRAGVQPSTAT